MTFIGVKDPWVKHAQEVILAEFGDNISIENKNKDLLKFGRSQQVQTSLTTLMTLPTGTYNETYVSSNLITTIVSTSTSDTTTVTIEGHTISGSDLTFVSQTATLNGQTGVTLGTALARATRVYANGSTDLVGTVSVCQNDTFTSGVPDTPVGVHLQVRAGKNQSEKASTSLSSSDYWIVTSFYADMLSKQASFAEVLLEIRRSGGVFRQVASISCSDKQSGRLDLLPYIIVPPNSDVRLRAAAGANGRDISGGICGVLAN